MHVDSLTDKVFIVRNIYYHHELAICKHYVIDNYSTQTHKHTHIHQ